MTLLDQLGSGPVALDTCIFIYFIEQRPRYLATLRALFEAVDRGALPAFTSSLTLLETLVVPYREGDQKLADEYEMLLRHSRGLGCVSIDAAVLRGAALLRARTGVRTPDAIQLATALQGECRAFLTNDRDLPALGRLQVLQLEDLL